jgi:hypothetical protein
VLLSVRYELALYILFRRNSAFKGLREFQAEFIKPLFYYTNFYSCKFITLINIIILFCFCEECIIEVQILSM